MNEKTRKWMAELATTPEYIAEGIALDLTLICEKRRDELGLSYAEVARRMGVSRQRVNVLFSGTQNSTIGSLVKLALVLDCKLEIGISPQPKKRATKQAQALCGQGRNVCKIETQATTEDSTQRAACLVISLKA